MKVLSYIFAIILCFACNNSQHTVHSKISDSLAVIPSKSELVNDTTIQYNLENISSEGTSAEAMYVAGKIKKCEISVFGETGQSKIIYVFKENNIYVSEKQLIYNTSFENTKSDKDMKVIKEITYVLDLNGNLISKGSFDRIDIFNEFKKIVPFQIK